MVLQQGVVGKLDFPQGKHAISRRLLHVSLSLLDSLTTSQRPVVIMEEVGAVWCYSITDL